MRFEEDKARPIYWFTVTGRDAFPMDMLRHDMAWPASTVDAARMLNDTTWRRSLRMGCALRGGPTIGRWSSFGWSVGDLDRGEVD
jgi:hypothetical protein